MTKRDADFSAKTIHIIASRAGYRCSFPGCDESTIGPGAGPNDVERKGTAAHIYAAGIGPYAPRGTGGHGKDERSSAANGIWLCRDHGTVIDNQQGKNYLASELLAWKALHEERIAGELRKVPTGNSGWLREIVFEDNPLFTKGSSITFGKVTLLIGANATGKTALCEWLGGAAGDTTSLERWAGASPRRPCIDLRIDILNPESSEFSLKFEGREVTVLRNGKVAFDFAHALRIIYIKDRTYAPHKDDLEYLAGIWGLHPYQAIDIVRTLCSSKYGLVKECRFLTEAEDGDGNVPDDVVSQRAGRNPISLRFRIGEHTQPVYFRALSSREQSQVIVSGAMVIAERRSSEQGALLIIELGGQFLPDDLLSMYADKLQGPEFRFQSLLISPTEHPKVNWTGWSKARLIGRPPKVQVEQD